MAAVINYLWNTTSLAGAPITLAGSPALKAVKDASGTSTATGLTLATDITVDASSVVGLHRITVDTADSFYTQGSDVSIVVSAGTVDGQSIAGTKVFTFSIEGRSHLVPTVVGRTLNVNATGEAEVDIQKINTVTIVGDGSATPFNV